MNKYTYKLDNVQLSNASDKAGINISTFSLFLHVPEQLAEYNGKLFPSIPFFSS